MKLMRMMTTVMGTLLLFCPAVTAQSGCSDQGTWTTQSFQQVGPTDAIENPVLLTDGRVMVQYVGTSQGGNQFQDWWALNPDPVHGGCYTNGTISCNATWSELASLTTIWGGTCPQSGQGAYGPGGGFASAVLADGKVIIEGGEENCGQEEAFTTHGALYNPFSSPDTWMAINPPDGWPVIGDSQGIVLPSGTFMLAACGVDDCNGYDMQQALLNESTLSWTITGTGKHDPNAEENWVLLPAGAGGSLAGQVLDVDIQSQDYNSETYNQQTGSWSSAGHTPQQLWGNQGAVNEIGPSILLPNGKVFSTGATQPQPALSAYSAVYNPALTLNQRWSEGPQFPLESPYGIQVGIGMGDSPAVVLPDGNVLMAPGLAPNGPPTYFMEWDGVSSSFCSITAPPAFTTLVSHETVDMLLLPTGQVLITTNTNRFAPPYLTPTYYVYTPASNSYPSGSQPMIASVSNTLTEGQTYPISGYGFNGLTQAVFFGDDYEGATNYPLVQITDSTGHKFFARTHNHSTMGVATGSQEVSTSFDVPPASSGIATGSGSLAVIANGIPSTTSIPVTIQASGATQGVVANAGH